jgi:DNA-binding HxlR family transcriptional regulator
LHEKADHICFCPLEGTIDIIGKKWALLIVNAIGNNGRLRFKGLMDELSGISPKTLSDSLKELRAEGLIKRESFAEIPPRVEYSLTEDGAELRKSIIPLLRWAAARNTTGKPRCAKIYEGISAHRVRDLP